MGDLFGLLFMLAVAVVMGVVCCARVNRYNPSGDCCEHGVRGGEGFDCKECMGVEEGHDERSAAAS